MKILKRSQIGFTDIKNRSIDLLICASGYEERCHFLATKIDLNNVRQKVAFSFNNENQNPFRIINDTQFKNLNFESILADPDSDSEIILYLNEHIDFSRSEYTIVIDYSGMSRIWYSAILNYFSNNSNSFAKVHLIFSYSVSCYINPLKEDIYNVHIGPINGFSNLTVPQMPTGLIIGLGYEKSRALGLNEYFDGETFIFYTQNSNEDKYAKEVEKNNSLLLAQVKKENILRYSILDINTLYNQLYLLCRDLKNDYRVILASCGPKTFSLCSLLISIELGDIDVWRISAGKAASPVNKTATGDLVLFEVHMGMPMKD